MNSRTRLRADLGALTVCGALMATALAQPLPADTLQAALAAVTALAPKDP